MAAVIVLCGMQGDHGRDESDSRLVYDCDGRRFRIAELNLIARLDSLCMVGVTDSAVMTTPFASSSRCGQPIPDTSGRSLPPK